MARQDLRGEVHVAIGVALQHLLGEAKIRNLDQAILEQHVGYSTGRCI